MGTTWSQFFPPTPALTETNLPSQEQKVFIVTGGYSGVGLELSKILYQKGGKVYIAGRAKETALKAIDSIKASSSSGGELIFLPLNLDDLMTVKPAVEAFIAAESRLDVLFNNAGVSNPPQGSVSVQGHDLAFSVNYLGHHLFTQLLIPTLIHTAKEQTSGSVRVIWLSSIVAEFVPKGGVGADQIQELLNRKTAPQRNYENTKVGNWFLADALAKQVGTEGVLSVVLNPGNLSTPLVRHLPRWMTLASSPLLYHAKMGAYTEIWAGFSGELKITDGGKYILPWGRLHPTPRQDLLDALKSKQEGGTGEAAMFIHFCDELIAEYK